MRKLILLASVLAVALVVASPALGQIAVAGDDNSVNCAQIQDAAVGNTQYAETGDVSDEGAAVAANELGISQNGSQDCVGAGGADSGDDVATDDEGPTAVAGDDNSVNCVQLQGVLVDNTQYAETGDVSGQGAATAANELGISQDASQNCVGAN